MTTDFSDTSAIRRFRIDVTAARLDMIRDRVRAFRWGAWIEPVDAGDWRYGPPAAYMRSLYDYWVDGYDWRQHEQAMNARPHFVTAIDGIDLHFVHEHGSGPNPMPLLIAHGWPYSFHPYDGLIDRLAHPERHGGKAEEAFTVIIPSYPGYDLSRHPQRRWGLTQRPSFSIS